MVLISSMKQCHFKGPRERAFSIAVVPQWNSIPPSPPPQKMILTLLTFHKALKTWLFLQASGQNVSPFHQVKRMIVMSSDEHNTFFIWVKYIFVFVFNSILAIENPQYQLSGWRGGEGEKLPTSGTVLIQIS